MTAVMVDAADIDHISLPPHDVLVAYGSAFGSRQGPARPTPALWLHAQPAPVWMVYFPGANPHAAIAEARSYPCVVGVAVDVEYTFERDAWSLAQAAAFGDVARDTVTPSAIYSHRRTCMALLGHFDALWAAGEPQPAQPHPREAVQWGYFGAYDVSAADSWFAAPTLAPQPPPVEKPTMNGQEVAAAIIGAYRDRAVKLAIANHGAVDAGTWHADQTDPKGFGDQVNAVLSGAADLHTVCNNIADV